MGLFKHSKNTNKSLIRQILDLVPPWLLHNCIAKHNSDKTSCDTLIPSITKLNSLIKISKNNLKNLNFLTKFNDNFENPYNLKNIINSESSKFNNKI